MEIKSSLSIIAISLFAHLIDSICKTVHDQTLWLSMVQVVFSLTIVSLTLENGSSLLSDQSVTRLFVEYQFLDYESSELETPASLPKPSVSKPAVFNFRKGKTTLIFFQKEPCFAVHIIVTVCAWMILL